MTCPHEHKEDYLHVQKRHCFLCRDCGTWLEMLEVFVEIDDPGLLTALEPLPALQANPLKAFNWEEIR